jgi:hypothetical protein
MPESPPSHPHRAAVGKLTLSKATAWFLVVNTSVVGLGQLSEAIELISNGIDYTRSQFSNSVDYAMLNKIQVGNTVEYIENEFGSPQVSRSIDERTTANYFHKRKFLLTLFYRDNRIVAFTVLPLIDDFQPEVDRGSEFALGEFSYSEFSPENNGYRIDHSNTVSFYLELVESGRSSLFTGRYVGQLDYGMGPTSPLIEQLYEEEVFGEPDQIRSLQDNLRQQARPNFYGEGLLPLDDIEKSLLTTAEFRRYFE